MAITYHRAPTELTFDVPETPLQVRLDGRVTGLIRKVTGGGFAYYPKGAGSKGRGEVFSTLDACKQSLEPEPAPAKICPNHGMMHAEENDCPKCGAELIF